MISMVSNKVSFNRRARKADAKDAKLNQYSSALCDLCIIPIGIGTLRPLRLMDFIFLKSRVILLFLFLVLVQDSFSQDYNYRNFNTEDGLPQSYIYSVIQDDKGYLWIGTGNGLSRFNGFTFENFTTADSLADNSITCGINDGEGLWFGHSNGLLSYFDGKKFQKIDLSQSTQSPVTHFTRSSDGSIWVSTYAGSLLKMRKGAGIVEQYRFKEQVSVVAFAFLDSVELIAGTNEGLLFCRLIDSGEIEIVRTVSEIPESRISAIQKIKDIPSYFIATQDDGIFQLSVNDKKFEASKVIVNSVDEPDISGIQDIFLTSKSDLLVATFGTGLIKLKSSISGELSGNRIFSKTNGFPTDNVKTLFEDREGNIWSGNYGEGLTQITTKAFSVQTFNEPLYGNNIFSICFDQKHKWIGTENGLVKIDLISGDVLNFYSSGRGLPKDTISALYSSETNGLWIGTGRNGLFHIVEGDDKILKYGTGNNGTLENSVTSITGKEEQIWIGTKKGLCNINSVNGKTKWYSIFNGGLPHNYINSLFYDSSDKLWVTTRSNTLVYIQNEIVSKMPLNSGRGILVLGPVTEDMDSRIWVGSNGNGVFMIESDSIINITAKEGLLSNYCYSLIFDNQNNLWVGHKVGLSRIRTTDFLVKPIQRIENMTENFQFNPNAMHKDPGGKMWFGSDKGIVSYDPSLEDPLKYPPVLGITSIRINDEVVEISDRIILPPGNYKIRIDFLGVNLKEPGLVNYQYKLEGYDQWSEISKNTFITFPRITDGNYKFILMASSGEGEVTKTPVTIDFIIKKFIWKRWWFYPAVILFILTITFIFIKRHISRLQKDKSILEAKIVERTSEIQFQKDEIELQRDLIDEKNENITSSIKYALHIQNAVLPPLEFINKLLPENFILSKPKDIVSGDFYWLAEKDNKVVFTVADCTGHGVPGAFMSLLGITLLNEIVNIQGILRSDAIITRLRERIIQCLQQSRKEITRSDGMDIALCVLDRKHNTIQFTGGMNDLVYVRETELFIIKADRTSVCATDTCSGVFTMKEINVKKGDVFYIFSDGFQDQFGGDNDKKYLSRKFYSSLLEIHELPMSKQKEVLETKFSEWMKDYVQTDDITVMGIRL